MKSLVLMLLMSVFGTSLFAQNRQPVEMTLDEKQAFLQSVDYTARGVRDDGKMGCADYYAELIEIYEDLYVQGFISLEQFNTVDILFKTNKNTGLGVQDTVNSNFSSDDEDENPPSVAQGTCGVDTILNHGTDVQFTGNLFKQQAVRFLQQWNNNKRNCAIQGDMATTAQCCEEHIRMPFVLYQPENQCKTKGNECSRHEDCCSQLCNKYGTGPGVCASEMSCYIPNEEGQACPPENPFCVEGTYCLNINHTSSGTNEYKNNGEACNSNEECASDKCLQGTCQQNSICTVCDPQGGTDTEKICCPGLYRGLSGACVPTFPPYTLPEGVNNNNKEFKKELKKESLDRVKKFFKLFVSNLIPIKSAKAQTGEDIREVLENRLGITNDDDNAIGNGLQDSINYGQDCLSPEQNKEIQECMALCSGENDHSNDADGKSGCIATCTDRQREMVEEAISQSSKGNGSCDVRRFSRDDYANINNVPAITSKTESNVKECEFNSYNDSWISASNYERNAEITLRAFEAVHSGTGTIDYIIDERGKSIYDRAQFVAKQLRKNRYELVKSFQELDQKMSCKCLAVFGPMKNFQFENNEIQVHSIGGVETITKKEYFGRYCRSDAGYVAEDGTREAEDNEGGNRSGLADETNVEGDGSGGDDFSTKMSEVDKGAVGLTHEKLIVEWLGLKRQVQMDRFQDNSELEAELESLINYISEYKWIRGNPGQYTTVNSGRVYMQYLYKFRVTYMPKWLAVVLTIIAIAALITAVLFSAGVFGAALAGMGGLISGLFIGGQILLAVAGALWSNVGPSNPSINDVKKGDGCHRRILGVCVTKYDKYYRYLEMPEFDNSRIASNVDNERKCKFHHYPMSCIKSMYRISGSFGDNEDMVFEKHPLLDPPLPLTMEPDVIDVSTVDGVRSYANKLENQFQTILGTCAGEGQSPSGNTGLCGTFSSRKGWKDGWPVDKKSRFMNKSLVDLGERLYKDFRPNGNFEGEEAFMALFSPEFGEWNPREFTSEMASKYKKAIKNYALCRKLGDDADERCKTYGVEVGTKDIGFGYLFEKEQDAVDFAEFAYQLHFMWPHLSATDKLGYPTIGQDAYFQSILYNLKLVGSIAIRRAMENFGAYNLYKASYLKRQGDYAGLEGAEVGDGSRNVELQDRVFEQFKGLDFSSKVNMEKFAAKMDGLSKDDSFNESDRGLFATASAAFKRRANDMKKREHFEENFGNTKRGKIKKERSAKFLNNFNSPLKNMDLNVGGKNLGRVSAPIGGEANVSSTASASTNNSAPKTATFEYKAPQIDTSSFGSSYGSRSSYESSSSSSNTSNKSGYGNLSKSDLEHMLKSAEKDKSLSETDPNDTIFAVVSKAYKRNLSRILVLKSAAVSESGPGLEIGKDQEVDISDSKKQNLKNLLDASTK
jgi:hypothetical protein